MFKLFKPLSVISKITPIFVLWLIFTIVIGLIGVIMTITLSSNCATWMNIMKSGSFYSIGIAMCSSFVSVFLINIIKKKRTAVFLSFKVVCIGFGVVLMIFMAGYYSSLMTGNSHSNNIQYTMYLLSLILCTYSFCIENLEEHYEDYKDLDDSAVENIKMKAKSITADSEGIKL